ncbi:bifunctional folylpolyglutamate synthase/dihydrofolate synthase [Anatilimnocola floriformis]|uniref:bifunctional folylpolyglutamate synthase/dihydrofolate synthase n=1 Tax=Anatilimnocola floriformis TaxID=2948575 RepID=UPI0020C403ED|nr:folylpolyglutamate synthase/dihydrofolate synthase family protein [Anatilimnocola floriformis]
MPAPFAVVDRTSALEFLFSRINYERTTQIPYRTGGLKLERMQALLRLVGDPHRAYPIVHIAGTKGKGSTATMIARILQAAGYKTGLYTSPHLERLEERFVINGQLCTEQEFVQLAADLEAATLKLEEREPLNRCPTFFEITTAMGLLHFARSGAEAVVLEVGLGGRLDSTNICTPRLSVITSISFDHVKQLGNTLAAIAREKAGIIKPGVPVVCGVCEEEPRNAIESVAILQQAPLLQRGIDFDFSVETDAAGRMQVEYREPAESPKTKLGPFPVGMLGEHQATNAATAIAVVRALQPQREFRISEDDIRVGLAEACCTARIEVVRESPTVILDVAHNLASIEALLAALDLRFPPAKQNGGCRILLFASSRDKDPTGMLKLLLPKFDRVIVTKYVNNPRAVEPEELCDLAHSLGAGEKVELAAEPQAAWQRARSLASDNDLICITGSFFLAAELRSQCVS